jgi:sugar-specific transcriptional regulator TrmB
MENNNKSKDDEPIQTFMSVGLTLLQAKLYLALAKFGNSGGGVRKISHESNIARQDIYRILPELEKRGLTVKIISSPATYRATPLENGFSILLNRKNEEYIQLQKRAKILFDNFTLDSVVEPQNKPIQFEITSEKNLYFTRVGKELKQAEKSMCIICSKEGFRIIAYQAFEEFERAMEKGIKIRVLTNYLETGAESKSIFRLKSNPNFELRILPGSFPVGLAMFDSKEVNIGITATIVPALWTNNDNVVKLSAVYFESMWNSVRKS